jgi:hypothetical protein
VRHVGFLLGETEDHAKATTAGFDSLMIKPLTEESLRKLIR